MDTDFKVKNSKHSPHKYLLLMLLFVWAVVMAFAMMQYFREQAFKISLLDSSLQQINLAVSEGLRRGENVDNLFKHSREHHPALRLTVMDSLGNVIYDSSADVAHTANHAQRPEFIEAKNKGKAYTVRRLSESMKQEYFYSALRSDSVIVRSALPYNVILNKDLNVTRTVLWFIIAVTLMVSIFAYITFRRMLNTENELQRQRERARFEEQQNVRIKKQLTGSINHELKTPISAISGCLETLIHNPQMEPEVRQDFITQCYNHTERLKKLLNDISIINRIDEATDLMGREKISLSQLINEVVEEWEHDAHLLFMPVKIEYMQDKALEIEGNAMLLRSIFRNLIENAAKYSGGTQIVIRYLHETTIHDERYFHILFYDNGNGVPDKHLTNLFERFYRVDKGRSRKLGGTGLGLSIVKNAVLLHGGNIEVHNRYEGGLEFKIAFRAENKNPQT